jgi:hypothetical protein
MELEETKKFNESIQLNPTLKINNINYFCDLISIVDMGMLKKITSDFSYNKFNCFYCWCKKEYDKLFFFKFNERVTKNLLGISSKKIFLCCLHLTQRILENIILLISHGNSIIKKNILDDFAFSPFLRNVKFKTKKKNLEENNEDNNNYNTEEKVSMITGNGCNSILNNNKILNFLTGEEKELFEMIKDLLKFIKNDIIYYTDNNLKILCGMIEKIKSLFSKIYNTSPGLYFHLLFNHFIKMIYNLKKKNISLFDIDNSSFELKNKMEKFIKNNRISKNINFKSNNSNYEKRIQTNNEINYKEILQIKKDLTESEKNRINSQFKCLQILLLQIRELYLCNNFNHLIKDLPNFKRKCRIFKQKKKNICSLDKYEDLKIEEKEFQEILKDQFSENFDESKIENYIKNLEFKSDLSELPENLKNLILKSFFFKL